MLAVWGKKDREADVHTHTHRERNMHTQTNAFQGPLQQLLFKVE